MDAGDQLPTGDSLTAQTDGKIDFNGFNYTLAGISTQGKVITGNANLTVDSIDNFSGSIDSGIGTINVGNLITGGNGEQIAGNLDYGSSNLQIFGDLLTTFPNLTFSAAISGSGDIEIGQGAVTFSGGNSYTGLTTVDTDGILAIENNAALGDPATGTVIDGNGSVILDGGIDINENFTVNGAGTSPYGSINGGTNISGNSIHGNITLNSDTAIGVIANGLFNIDGSIIGAHNVSFINVNPTCGCALLVFTGPQLHVGTTLVGTGIDLANLGVGGEFSDNDRITVQTGALLEIVNYDDTIGSLEGDGDLNLFGAELTIGKDNTSTTYNGFIDGFGDIVKIGTGTLTLTGNSTYSGNVNIDEGKLIVNGDMNGNTVLLEGGILGGNGTVGNVFSNSGVISPGNSPGIITVSGDLILNSLTTTDIEINGTTAGTQYDQIDVTGNADLGDSNLNVILGYTPTVGDSFTILQTEIGGTISGIFGGLSDGSTFTISGVTFRINYTSNTVVLTVTALALANTGINIPLTSLLLIATLSGTGILG